MQLEDRIARLEKRCRLLSSALGLCLLTAAMIVVTGASGKDDAAADTKELKIVDADGNTRIHLGKTDGGGYGIVMRDASGGVQASITEIERTTVLRLAKERYEMRLMVGAEAAGFAIRGSNGKLRGGFQVGEKDSRIEIRDPEGKALFTAPETK